MWNCKIYIDDVLEPCIVDVTAYAVDEAYSVREVLSPDLLSIDFDVSVLIIP
jgi:hypothetical protein